MKTVRQHTGVMEAKRRADNAKKAKVAADYLFPGEKWITVEDGIYLSPHRPVGKNSNYKDELRDAQILRDLGSVVYLVREDNRSNEKQFDAVVDGVKLEFKNMSGKANDTLIDHFYKSREQAPNVFINLEESPLSKERILRVLYGARNSHKYNDYNKYQEGGKLILKIKGYDNLEYLDINDMKK
jgi:hypothetical protein